MKFWASTFNFLKKLYKRKETNNKKFIKKKKSIKVMVSWILISQIISVIILTILPTLNSYELCKEKWDRYRVGIQFSIHSY